MAFSPLMKFCAPFNEWGLAVGRIACLLPVALVAACTPEGRQYSSSPADALEETQEYLAKSKGYESEKNSSSLSVGRIALGKKLFHDKRLSIDGNSACSTCHNPVEAYTQNRRSVPPGASRRTGGRNAPTLYDVVYRRPLFRDGRANTLEAQVDGPLLAANEMANPSMEHLAARVRGMKDYERFFLYAFSKPADEASIRSALSAYQRTLITGPSRFDQWKFDGRKRRLKKNEIAGYELFVGKGGCSSCHTIGETSAPLTDNQFHDTGYSRTKPAEFASVDTGRHGVTKNSADKFAFRTPSLRNVALTAPYMHDGGLKSLRDVIAFFNESRSLELTAQERADLEVFLRSLTSLRRP
ncbi:MAG: cytochrome c peroxidase [Pseudomonadota bacterium]